MVRRASPALSGYTRIIEGNDASEKPEQISEVRATCKMASTMTCNEVIWKEKM